MAMGLSLLIGVFGCNLLGRVHSVIFIDDRAHGVYSTGLVIVWYGESSSRS